MNNTTETIFGNSFERIIVAFLSVVTGIILIYMAIIGPLYLDLIRYKTAEVINNQLAGQDIINIFLLSPILISGGVALFLKKPFSRYLIITTPLYLIYYVLSYTIGCEWSSPTYTGNNEAYIFYFLFILISSLITLLYSLSIFPKKVQSSFRKRGLVIYSVIFILFLLVFSSMWIKEVIQVIKTGTARGYDIAPTAFWLVRIFDLGFTIPLGLVSVYLLWVRPNTTFPIQFMFYGFFITMIIAVNAMGFIMFLNNDPTFLLRDLIVFVILGLIIAIGFFYILRNYKISD
jgi:hypothetical protein